MKKILKYSLISIIGLSIISSIVFFIFIFPKIQKNITNKKIDEKIASIIEEFYEHKELYDNVVISLNDVEFLQKDNVNVYLYGGVTISDKKATDYIYEYIYGVENAAEKINVSKSVLFVETIKENISFEQRANVMDGDKLRYCFDMAIFYCDKDNLGTKKTGKLNDSWRDYRIMELGDNWYYTVWVFWGH